MTREDVISSIQMEMPKLKSKYGVECIGLFGSYAKKNERSDSDLDFLVDHNPPYAKNYFELLFYLEKRFNKKIALVRRVNIYEANL